MTVDSSSTKELEVDAEVKDVNKEVTADPSGADVDVKKPESMLEAVKAAIAPVEAAKDKDDGEVSSDLKDGKTDGEVPKDGEKSLEPQKDSEEDKEPPFAKHPRWQKMLHTNRELDAEVKKLTPVVEEFEQFRGHVRDVGLNADEVNQGFAIMAEMKRDPAKALELLKPHLKGLQLFVGEVLPEDLQAKVDAGHVDEASAREMAKLRNANAHTAELTKVDGQRREEESRARTDADQRTAQKAFGDSCAAAVAAEEKAWKETDPDHPKKAKFIDREVAALLKEKGHTIRTKEDAVNLTREAKKNVEQAIGGFSAKKEPKRMVSGGGKSAGNSPRPKTFAEAVRIAAGDG